jgi:dienelactone hydrolase
MEFARVLPRTAMRSLLSGFAALIGMMFVYSACADDVIQQPIRVPIDDPSGHHRLMSGYICRPSGVENPKLVVINHGSSTIAADRSWTPLGSCNNEAVRWFMDRHYAVVQAWRLGYGPTGGTWTEGFVHCMTADYYKAGLETARQIEAIVDYAISLPGVDPNGVVVVGHSGGGWGAIAYDDLPHPHVSAIINMAGGRGGHYHAKADSNCGADQLVAAVRLFAKTSSTPMLWIYANNDSYFGPRLANEMAEAYVSAGGKLRIYESASESMDGHSLFFDTGGSKVWGPLIQHYLDDRRSATLSRK